MAYPNKKRNQSKIWWYVGAIGVALYFTRGSWLPKVNEMFNKKG